MVESAESSVCVDVVEECGPEKTESWLVDERIEH